MKKQDLNNFKQQDLYSLALFTLYKIGDIPEYSSCSELAYVLDRKNFFKLLEIFGGQTISIPTRQEFENVIYALLLHQYITEENMDYDSAIQLIGHEAKDLRQVKRNYQAVCNVLANYKVEARN